MFDDGRLLVLLGLAGVAAAPALTGSRGVARAAFQKPELLRIVNSGGRPFHVRIVKQGDRYGLDDVLVFPDPKNSFETDRARAGDCMVEFYDASNLTRDPRGQFVARYYLSTLKDRDPRHGLPLQGDVPEWTVSAKNVQDAVTFAKRS